MKWLATLEETGKTRIRGREIMTIFDLLAPVLDGATVIANKKNWLVKQHSVCALEKRERRTTKEVKIAQMLIQPCSAMGMNGN